MGRGCAVPQLPTVLTDPSRSSRGAQPGPQRDFLQPAPSPLFSGSKLESHSFIQDEENGLKQEFRF